MINYQITADDIQAISKAFARLIARVAVMYTAFALAGWTLSVLVNQLFGGGHWWLEAAAGAILLFAGIRVGYFLVIVSHRYCTGKKSEQYIRESVKCIYLREGYEDKKVIVHSSGVLRKTVALHVWFYDSEWEANRIFECEDGEDL